MEYLTQAELDHVRFRGNENFPAREPTNIEKVIQRIPAAFHLPEETTEERLLKKETYEDIVRQLFKLTLTPRLGDKVKAALVNQEAMEAFMDLYPYAKHEAAINSMEPLTMIERLGMAKFTLHDVQLILQWLARLNILFGKLPKGVDTFIWTGEAARWNTHHLVERTGEKAYYGWHLPIEVQNQVNGLFAKDANVSHKRGEPGWALVHARAYDVYNIPDIWKRAKLEDVQHDFVIEDLEINFIHPVSKNGGWLPYQLELVQKSSNTRLRFFVPTAQWF